SLIPDVAGVESRCRLEKKNVRFFIRDRPVLDAGGYDQELTFLEPDIPFPELHPESAFDHEKQLVFLLMVMPDERALKLYELDMLAVQLTDDPGTPMFTKVGELVRKVYLVHDFSPRKPLRTAVVGLP